jgi:hypothetical protein
MLTKSKFILKTAIALLLLNLVQYSQDKIKEDNNKTEDEFTFVYVTKKSNEELKLDFTKVIFEVTLEKNNLMFLEPLVIKFKFSNQTDKQIEFYKPNLSDIELQITNEGGKFVLHKDLFAFYINRPRSISRLAPGESIEEIFITKPGNDRLFKESGNFQLKFFIAQDEKKWSNVNNVVIKEPEGEDLEVWNKIKDKKSFAYFIQNAEILGSNIDPEETAKFQAEVEDILQKYPNSFYAQSLRQSLDKFKANEAKRQEFQEKIKSQQKQKP